MKHLFALVILLSLPGCHQLYLNSPPSSATQSPAPGNSVDIVAIVQTQPATNSDSTPVSTDSQLQLTQTELPIDLPIDPDQFLLPAVAQHTDLWDRLRMGYQLEHGNQNKRTKAELRWFSSNQEYLNRVVIRATRYLYFVLGEVEARNLPTELALLPIVESAYDPFAYSHGRAMGIWQFIPATGKLYGLTQDWWYDGRRDIKSSTKAALDYLEALHNAFNQDWQLALAAYNSGEGNVRAAIRKNQRLGKPTDFWSLDLPSETRAYVPKLLAISRLIANPEAFGIVLNSIPDKPYWVQVDTGSQIDLAEAARLAQISVAELYLLNPGFNQWSTHPNGPNHLLLPVDKEQLFYANLQQLPRKDRVGWQRHRIRSGESLGLLAEKYNTTIHTLRLVNQIKGNLIRAGDSMLIPVALNSNEQYVLSSDERLKSTQRYLEQKLGHSAQNYTVQSGDSLWTIARKFRVNLRSLAKWNGLATTDILYPGTLLKIFTTARLTTLYTPSSAQVPGAIRKLNYRVRRGESLSRIADKFNLSVKKIKGWNGSLAGKKYIQPGQHLTLYVDVTQTE